MFDMLKDAHARSYEVYPCRGVLFLKQLIVPVSLHFTPMLIRRDKLVQAFWASGAYFH